MHKKFLNYPSVFPRTDGFFLPQCLTGIFHSPPILSGKSLSPSPSENAHPEEERENFLRAFEMGREKSLIGFGVLGGIFSEGIDLTNEKLIGTLIIGTGLPQVCNEREILKSYFDQKGLFSLPISNARRKFSRSSSSDARSCVNS